MTEHHPYLLSSRYGVRAECLCGWFTRERAWTTVTGAHLAFGEHLLRQAGPPRCPRCGNGAVSCSDTDPTAGRRYLHEVVCDSPWSDDECERCSLIVTLENLPYESERTSRRMLGAA